MANRVLNGAERLVMEIVHGAPQPKLAIAVAVSNKHGMGKAAEALIDLDRAGIIYTNPQGDVDTTWTWEDIQRGYKEP